MWKTKIVTGVTTSHLDQLTVMLSSLFSKGKVSVDSVVVVCSGNAAESLQLEKNVRNRWRGIETIRVDPKEESFRFLQPVLDRNLNALYFDYLRAWVGQHISNYLWLDADILVRRPAPLGLLKTSSHCLAMAQDFSPTQGADTEFHRRMWELYIRMVNRAGIDPRSALRNRVGDPIKFNCGVLHATKNLSFAWKETFDACLPILEVYKEELKAPALYAEGVENTFGQGIWNVLMARFGGRELSWEWNNLRLAHPSREGYFDHYAVVKQSFIADAKVAGYLPHIKYEG